MIRMAVLSGGEERTGRELDGLLRNGLSSPRLGMGWEMEDRMGVEQGVPVVVCDGVCCIHLGARTWSWSRRTMSMAGQLGVASSLVRLIFLTGATVRAYEALPSGLLSLTTMTSIGTGYDLSASTYSPDGRIFQVRHHPKSPFQLRRMPSRSSMLTRPSRTRGMCLSVPTDHTHKSCYLAPRSASESKTVSSLP